MLDLSKNPTRNECLLAMCHGCMGHYVDGKVDCKNHTCPLYAYMPYRGENPNFVWRQYNPRRAGLVTWEESKRNLTDEQKQAMIDRLRGAK